MDKCRYSLLLFLLLLAACQTAPAAPTSTLAAPTAVKTPSPTSTPIPVSTLDVDEADLTGIELEVWHSWYDAPAALFELQMEEFNRENSWGITVSASYRGSYNMLFYDVTDAQSAAERPHIVVALPEQISVWHQAHTVKDLAPYIDDPVWGFTAAEKADFPGVFLEQDQAEDARLALPAQRTARFILYNQTWGEELGFDEPPADFAEFEEQACAANRSKRLDENTADDGKGGWIVDDDSQGVLAWMRGFDGGPFLNGEYQFIYTENINAFKSIKSLYDEGCAWLSSADTPYEQFALRSALMITASLEEFPEIKRAFAEANNRDHWTAIPFPGEARPALITYGVSYALLETEDAEALAAWLFVKWMLDPQRQAKWVQSTALYPLRISALEELSAYQKANPQWAEAVELIPQAEIYPQLASWHKVRYLLGDGFTYMFRSDVQAGSVAAILAQMNDAARALNK